MECNDAEAKGPELSALSENATPAGGRPTETAEPPPPTETSLTPVAIFFALYFVTGYVCFYLLRRQMNGTKSAGVIDAAYFCVVTMTTLGYGDIVPDTVLTKLITCAYAVTGFVLCGYYLNKVADFVLDKQQRLLSRDGKDANQNSRPTGNKVYQKMTAYFHGNKVSQKMTTAERKCVLVATILLVDVIVGCIVLVTVENLRFVDAFYCVCITVTTLGYGDVTFRTKGGRVFAVFWILTSIASWAQFFFYIAELKTERKQKKLIDQVLGQPFTESDLKAADLDGDGHLRTTKLIFPYEISRISRVIQIHKPGISKREQQSSLYIQNQELQSNVFLHYYLESLPPFLSFFTDTPKRRRYRRSKSAPFADSVSMETICTSPTPSLKAIFANLDPTLMQVALFLAIYLVVGTLCFYNLRPQMKGKKTDAIIDTVYFCIVTIATVGYGDLVPDSNLTKLLACAFAFTGVTVVGLVLSKAADSLVKKHENLLITALDMYQNRGQTETIKKVETNRVRSKCLLVFLLLLVLIITGTTFLATVEKLNLVDAFYCVCVTVTTLGYGDESFKTKEGRVFAVFWIPISAITLAQFYAYMAELNTESRHTEFVKRVVWFNFLVRPFYFHRPAEFILYRLKKMGKISEHDISLGREGFEYLDADQSIQSIISF
ncbi:Two-pore potassium channel 1 [Morella rubra]|uniref:Two-pore potassium channel 1 n=1 Tax=Morella rubra TaxID=262757 RepID=A0A6A1VQB0_9ROSI|nr:Two-pore potassium channel 1 [Morella rubra]